MSPASRAGELRIRHEAQEDRHTLILVGELDLATAGDLEATIGRLCDDGAREIVLDLHELSFIDSSGLRVILTARQLCEGHACDFSLTRVQVPVQRLFEQTGLAERLSFRGRALAKRLSPRGSSGAIERFDAGRPDLVASLELDPGAARSARGYVGDLLRDVARNVREAAMLLTSEIVTRAIRQGPSASADGIELCAWASDELVRIELRARSRQLFVPPESGGPHYDHLLLDQLADRWSIDAHEPQASWWFELDPRRTRGELMTLPGKGDKAVEQTADASASGRVAELPRTGEHPDEAGQPERR